MTEATVFRRIRAVDPAGALDAEVDVVVERGRVTRVGRDAAADLVKSERVRVFERPGAWLLPGFVDLHAHLREPGAEGKEDVQSGLRAAAAGGFVDVCCMPNTRPVNDSRVVTEMLVAKARTLELVRLHPIGAITVGQKGEQLAEMADMRAGGAVAVSDDGRCVTNSQVMRRALEYAATFDLPVIQHAEDHALTEGAQMHEGSISTRLGLRGWPRVAEDVIVARDVLLAEYVGARYHLAHASTAGSVRILREAKARGIAVSAEVTPHHLLLTHEALLGYDTACKVNPPLREAEDVEALRLALADGTIDCIATDHAPHGVLDKNVELAEAAPGLIGLELCLPLLLGLVRQGVVPLARLIDALTRAPARIVGFEPPRIRDGARADLVLVDPLARWTVDPARLRTKSRNTPFAGHAVQGRVELTMCEGRIVHEEMSGTPLEAV
ncbi:MAG TPA: dihydroorotase [Polyangiaceae bacterium]|jgi:dihydroorotase|nr:dihydroorotase [Polyangiaceae bacterium]